MEIRYDKPITNTEEDKYGRKAIASSILDVVNSITCNESFVIGISGGWGSGKTSILNLVIEELSADDCADAVEVIRFNPWMASSQEQIIRLFFEELVQCIEGSKGRLKDAASEITGLIDEYYRKIEPFFVSVITTAVSPALTPLGATAAVSASSNMFKRALNKIRAKRDRSGKPLSQLKDEIGKLLTSHANRIVIVIDDIDRLDTEEIKQIFKLVNLTASFPRIIYMLAYDPVVVETALSDMQGINGRDYLEKIVQVEFQVPYLSERTLQIELDEFLGCIITHKDEIELQGREERGRLSIIIENLYLPINWTPRKLKRLLNTLQIAARKSKHRICVVDMIALTCIQLEHQPLFQWIKQNKKDLCAVRYKYQESGKPLDSLLSTFNLAIEKTEIDSDQGIAAISSLFPSAQRLLTGTPSYSGISSQSAKARGRIASIDILDLFFQVVEAPFFDRNEVFETISTGTGEEIRALIQDGIDNNVFLDFIYLVKENISFLTNSQTLLLADCLMDSFGCSTESDHLLLFDTDADDVLGKTLRSLFCEIGLEAASKLLSRKIDSLSAANFIGLTLFMRDERLEQRSEGDFTPCMTDECYELLSKKYVDAVFDKSIAVLESGDIRSISIARALSEEFGMHRHDEFEECLKKNEKMRVLYLAGKLARFIEGDGHSFSKDGMSEDVSQSEMSCVMDHAFLERLAPEAGARIGALWIFANDSSIDSVACEDARSQYQKLLNGEVD